MKPHLKQRILRKIAAALLDADLSPAQMREAGRAVAHDAVFQRELSEMLFHLEAAIEATGLKTTPMDTVHLPDSRRMWLSRALALVQQKRKSKREIGELLAMMWPHLASTVDSDLTMRNLLAQFVAQASESDLENLERALQGPSDDPYLRGILRRNEGKQRDSR